MSAVHPEPGLRVGDRYVLTERIAGGGMGEVWGALDDVLGREVAVKLLRREYADEESFLTRFRAEARHAASLSHPGIASVYDYGEDDGVAYLVMELVNGEPLSARLAREGALPATVAVPLLQQAAAALQAAHDGGLVHRDVKPANLLLTTDDTVKITDFGIARAGDQSPITRTGEVMGTAQYLSPEQATGRGATPSSDVYALGVVAYEALAGRRPFDADSMVATALAQVNDAPDPLPASVPAPVAAVVMQALAKDPAQRPASAAELGAAFGGALAAAPTTGGLPTDATQALGAGAAALLTGAPAALSAAGATAPIAATAATASTASLPALGGAAAGPPARGAVLPPQTDGPSPAGRRRGVLLAVLAVLVVAALVALALSQLGGDGTSTTGAGTATSGGVTSASQPTSQTQTSPTEQSQTEQSQTSQTTQASTPGTITLAAGDYVGRPEQDVRDDLRALGLRTRSVKVDSAEAKGTVISLTPTDGLRAGDTVTLQVSDAKGAGAPTTTRTTPATPATPPSGSGSVTTGTGGGGSSTSPASSPTQRGTSTGAEPATPTRRGGGG